MMIQKTDTLYEVTERFSDTVEVFVRAGLKRMADAEMRRKYGPAITVQAVAEARGIELSDLLKRLEKAATGPDEAARPVGTSIAEPRAPEGKSASVRIMGLVPCPIRVPLTNTLDDFARRYTAETGIEVDYNLQAAYTGTEWMEESIPADPSSSDIPDIFLSAGFRMFFTDRRFLKLRAQGAFADRSGWEHHNAFGRANGLMDPERRFSVISVVPAVFMVNRQVLGNRPVPASWEDVLQPEYENSLALPIGDFDLFDALLLGIYRRFGMEGIERLGRNMHQSLHPAQMIAGAQGGSGSDGRGGRGGSGGSDGYGSSGAPPLITIMPYFFTRTINEHSPLIPIWPEDGALAAPVLLISRTDRPEIQPAIDFLTGLPVSRMLSRLGLFPSTHPENDDFSAEESPLQWPGWDFLLSPRLPELLEDTTAAFHAATTPVHVMPGA
jgi:ABC-type Fe3+ transport system substrate-binding protein